MQRWLLEIEGLTTDYESSDGVRVTTLDDVSLAVAEGEILGIVGESGAGKTVLLRTILGVNYANERVLGGSIVYRGHRLPIHDEDAMRAFRGGTMAIIQAGARARLDPVRRIGQMLSDVMSAQDGVPKAERYRRSVELLQAVGIPDPQHQLNAYPHELSGGMSQRVVIALALANSPELLMADEPTAGLDVTIQTQILDLFRSLVRESGVGSILATRDLAQLAHYCDRVIVLQSGEVVEHSAVAQFFDRPESEHGRHLLQASMAARGENTQGAKGTVTTIERWSSESARDEDADRSGDTAPVLEVENLVKHFKTQRHVVHAVNGVSFKIAPGRTLALVGESGSGKTTVGRCIAGLIHPTDGVIRLRGSDVAHISTRGRSRDAALETHVVFQEPRESLNPRWQLGSSIEEPLRHQRKLDAGARAARVLELLDLVRLPPQVADYFPHQTSAGVQQRVAIARAIAVHPKLVVLDEPTSALDMSVKAQVIDLLGDLQSELGLSYLFISHDMTAVKMIADDIAVMYLGRVFEYAPADDLFAEQANPYGRALLSSVLYPDPRQERSVFRLEGEIPSAINLPPGCALASRCPLALPRCNEIRPPLGRVGTSGRLSACLRTEEIMAVGGVELLQAADRAAENSSVKGDAISA